MLIITFLVVTVFSLQPKDISPDPIPSFILVKDATTSKEQIAGHILLENIRNGKSACAAVEIALCESNLEEFAQNTNSTAKGIYQFIDGTWNSYCKGNVFNHKDNIRCFIESYSKTPQWWECKSSL